jgi:hypothetical protein
MAVHYPLHLQERAARIFKQRMAEVAKVRASAATRLADLIAPPFRAIPVKVSVMPRCRVGDADASQNEIAPGRGGENPIFFGR